MKLRDRTGEIGFNNFGSRMIINSYRNKSDIDVYFSEYEYIKKNCFYENFKKGSIKCEYEPRVYGIGYLGVGEYEVHDKYKKTTKCYKTWSHMLERCYDPYYINGFPTYRDCTVCDEWHNFQNFAKWYDENYYEVEEERMELDKDILVKGNKTYSPDTCMFVPRNINSMFVKRDNSRGSCPIGVRCLKLNEKYCSSIVIDGRRIYLGNFENCEDAFYEYKKAKEYEIKRRAEKYKSKIPNRLYIALNTYTVEISD